MRTYREVYGLPDNPSVSCKGLTGHRCGRSQAADMMTDIGHLPEAVRGDARFVCDTCIWWLERDGVTTRAEIAKAHGAPAETVRALQHARDADDGLLAKPDRDALAKRRATWQKTLSRKDGKGAR